MAMNPDRRDVLRTLAALLAAPFLPAVPLLAAPLPPALDSIDFVANDDGELMLWILRPVFERLLDGTFVHRPDKEKWVCLGPCKQSDLPPLGGSVSWQVPAASS